MNRAWPLLGQADVLCGTTGQPGRVTAAPRGKGVANDMTASRVGSLRAEIEPWSAAKAPGGLALRPWLGAVVLLVLLGCGGAGGGQTAEFVVIGTIPAVGATEVDPTAAIVVSFSQAADPPSLAFTLPPCRYRGLLDQR